MKYLVTVVQGITVTADSPKEAEAQGLAMCDGGFAETIAVEVETTRREETGEVSTPDEAVAAMHAAYVAMLEAYADWRDVSQNGHETRAAFTRAALTYCHKVTRVTERVNV